MGSKYDGLLLDKDVERWYENLAAKSIITADVYLRSLGLYCSLNNTSPKKILEQSGRKRFRDDFSDFVRRLEKEGKAGSYIARFKKVVLSWLAYNNLSVKLRVNIRGEADSPTIADERVPTKEELAKIIRKASARGRVAIALMAFSGVRPESLGDYLGKDGLRLRDLKEAKITPKRVEFKKIPIPTILAIRSNLSKARHQYFTFVPEEAITYMKEYLEERAKAGERFNEHTPIFQFDPRGKQKNTFLRTHLLTRDIKQAVRAAQYSWRPYVLRSYCATAFDIAESKGLISHPWRQFFMGHKGDIEARYSTNKGRLPPDMIEEMREAYKRCEPFLQTLRAEPEDQEMIKRAFREQLLMVAGFKQDEVEKMDLSSIEDKELQSMIRQRLLGVMENNGSKQKVIPIGDVESYITQGWEYVSALPNERAILRVPF